jgi:hypothetical protein
MAEERDRTKRYANPPKHGKKAAGAAPAAETGAAKSEAEKTASGKDAPHPKDPDKVGKVGADPGPDAGTDATWGVVASRHKREHGEMLKRHGEEHEGMRGRHETEAKAMHTRHASEMKDHQEEGAESEAEATAGTPKELGKEKPEGDKGSNA